MEATLNRVELVGRLPEDANTKYLENGMAITKFHVEVGRREYADDPDVVIDKKGTVMVPCILFNQATRGATLIQGMRVMVIGFLNHKAGESVEDQRMNVIANKIIFMDKARIVQSPPMTVPPKVPYKKRK